MLLDSKKHDELYDDLLSLEDEDQLAMERKLAMSVAEHLDDDLDDEDDNDEDGDDNNDDSPSLLSEIFSYVKIFVFATILALLVNRFLILNATVPSGSMNNTIMEGDRLIGLRTAYLFSEPIRGDIIIFKYPDNPSEKFIKRVIGLPGDRVEIKDEGNIVNVYVNGELLNEPYIKEAMYIDHDFTYDVPLNCYFVLGDNRNNSKDSRYWTHTFVPKDYILAKACFKYIPAFKILEKPTYE